MGIVMKYAVLNAKTRDLISTHATWEQAVRAVWRQHVDCVIRERDRDGERTYDPGTGAVIERD